METEIIEYKNIDKILENINITSLNNILNDNDKILINDNTFYFSILLPDMGDEVSINIDKSLTNTFYEKGLDYSSLLKSNIPYMNIYKIVFALDKKKYIIIEDIDVLNFLKSENKLLNTFVDIIDKCEKDYRRIDEILYNIKKKVTFINFFDSYHIIEYTDKLLLYTLNYDNLIKDMIMVSSRIVIDVDYDKTKNKDHLIFKNRITIFKNNIDNLHNNLEQTRRGTMQRIAYLDSGTSRILTIVASIFLPTSFLISTLSMPYKGVPLRNVWYGYYVVITIIIMIFIISFMYFYKDFLIIYNNKS